jgi:flagellin FlaB
VLVAAIAAGVLINTAGFLQSQAEATGEESTNQVSNGVDITSTVASSGGDTVTLTVSLQSGSDPVNLDDAEIQLVGDSTTTLDNDPLSDDTNLGANGISAVTAETTGNNVLESQGDVYEIEIDMTSALSSLSAGDEVELTLTTASGAQTFKTLRVGQSPDFPEKV